MRANPEQDHACNRAVVRVSWLALAVACLWATLALLRYHTFHNETFDLAFYGRMTWGLGHGDPRHPLTDSHFLGLHASWVLLPLGLLSRWLPTIPLLLVVQAAALAGAAIPLANFAARRVRHAHAADFALLAFVLYPPIFTAATYEFHPSTLALFPLFLAVDLHDRGRHRASLVALGLAALCREDVALVAACAAGLFAWQRSARPRREAALFALAMLVYFLGYFLLIAPRLIPQRGSLSLHFGSIGSTPGGLVRAVLLHPLSTLGAVLTPAKCLYIPRLLAPLAFMSLLSPRWLIPALAPLAINLLSAWPTAVQTRSHYALLIAPFVLLSAIEGVARLVDADHALGPPAVRPTGRRMLALAAAVLLVALGITQRRAGATPLSRWWNTSHFRQDFRSQNLARIVQQVRPEVMVVAPDEVLAHLSERNDFQRAAQWTRRADDLILSVEHRARIGESQDLWRSDEEIVLRNVLTRARYGLVHAESTHMLFRYGVSPRAYATGRYIAFEPEPWAEARHVDIDASLAVASFRLQAQDSTHTRVTLWLVALQRWPTDMALELGWGPMHPSGDRLDPEHIHSFLLFDGRLSPVHIRVREVSRTETTLAVAIGALAQSSLVIGTRRLDGSRMHRESPHWVPLLARSPRPAGAQ
ncbi:MAG: DUF2079 domain-containing protein [Deltaproteobacteria bacterium]|nr:DUF2079 domain-containing protein [Deltaproteobacteria bacterium]